MHTQRKHPRLPGNLSLNRALLTGQGARADENKVGDKRYINIKPPPILAKAVTRAISLQGRVAGR